MDKIIKQISLEGFKGRFNHKNSYLIADSTIVDNVAEKKGNWNFIPLDCYFDNKDKCEFYTIKNKLPFVKGVLYDKIKNKYTIVDDVLRYKTIIYWYNWIISFGNSCEYYRLCKHNNSLIWVNIEGDFFDENYGIEDLTLPIKTVSSIPSKNSDYKIGDIVESNEKADIFNDVFRVNDDKTRYELKLFNFIQEFFNGEHNDLAISMPFTDIPIYISQNYDNIGILNSYAKKWNPLKMYDVGETTVYENDTYILTDGEIYNLTEIKGNLHTSFYDKFINNTENVYYDFVSYSNLDSYKENKKIFNGEKHVVFYKKQQKNSEVKFYLPFISHKATYDKTNDEYIFDTNLWHKNNDNRDRDINVDENDIVLDGVLKGENINNVNINTKTESKLSSIRRYKKSVDEDGNILPFIISENGSTDTELLFKLGIINVNVNNNDDVYCDILKEIKISSKNDKENIVLSFNDDKQNIEIQKNITKKIDENIHDHIVLSDNIILSINEESKKFNYSWVEEKITNEFDETIKLVSNLPSITDDYYNKKVQIQKTIDSEVLYTIYICKIDSVSINYNGVCDTKTPVKTSFMEMSNKDYIDGKGVISFTYMKDVLIDAEKQTIIPNTGVIYNETYDYEIILFYINYVSNDKIELNNNIDHKYVLCDYKITGNETEILPYAPQKKLTHKNVGEIYTIKDAYGQIIGYKRVLSEYKGIDIDFDAKKIEISYGNIDNMTKNIILSDITVSHKQIMEDNFQKDYVFKNEFLIGIEDVSETIDANIERGIFSAYERHHILSEIKTMSDLENYRNNFFKI